MGTLHVGATCALTVLGSTPTDVNHSSSIDPLFVAASTCLILVTTCCIIRVGSLVYRYESECFQLGLYSFLANRWAARLWQLRLQSGGQPD